MRITDCHTHIYPEKIAEKASSGVGAFYDAPMKYVGNCGNLLDVGNNAGITNYWVYSVATSPSQVRSINRFIAEQCELHPEFVGFGTLHPDVENVEEEVENIIALGLHGVKFHPDFQKFLIDEDRAMPMYECIAGRLPIIMHTGDHRYPYSEPERMARVLRRFPELDCVCAHFGGWSLWERAYESLYDTQCMVDTSSTFGFLKDDEASIKLIERWGTDRLLFGSDYPMWNSADELAMIRSYITDEEKLEDVLWRNAERFLKRTYKV